MSFGHLPSARREEAFRAIDAWRMMKQAGVGSRCEENSRAIMTFLGFEHGRTDEPVVHGEGTSWIHLRLPLSASVLARPIPQFGSGANGIYDIVCLFERPGTDSIAALLEVQRLSETQSIVLFLGRMSMKQRIDLSRTCRAQKLTCSLWTRRCCCSWRGNRRPAARLLRCALPSPVSTPIHERCRICAPEIFYGRKALLREIHNPTGDASSMEAAAGNPPLLMRAETDFHHPSGTVRALTGAAVGIRPGFQRIRARCGWKSAPGSRRKTCCQPRSPRKRRTGFAITYADAMNKSKDMRIIALFDETDDFLDEDAKNGFQRVIEYGTSCTGPRAGSA